MKYSWKLIRRVTFGVLLLVLIIAAKPAGVFMNLFLLTIYGITLGGVWAWKHIYLGGLDRIAKKNADAMVAAQEKAARKHDDQGYLK